MDTETHMWYTRESPKISNLEAIIIYLINLSDLKKKEIKVSKNSWLNIMKKENLQNYH